MKESDKNKTAIIEHDSANEISNEQIAPKSSSTKSSQQASSPHVQLLTLAKNFALDGCFKPVEKQMPLEDRSRKRERLTIARQQQNMETIVEKSLHYCSDQDVISKADPDWFSSFVTLAENISNKTMQELWAKILAGEISSPGSFSLKSIKTFRQLSMNDARLLGKACTLAVKDSQSKHLRVISGCYQTPGLFNMFDKHREQHIPLGAYGLNYAEILSLADNHIIFLQEAESHPFAKGEELTLKYNGLPLTLKAKKANSVLQFYKFTPIGAELAQLIKDKPDDEFFALLKNQLSYHFTS